MLAAAADPRRSNTQPEVTGVALVVFNRKAARAQPARGVPLELENGCDRTPGAQGLDQRPGGVEIAVVDGRRADLARRR
jgi:hypothetical protein